MSISPSSLQVIREVLRHLARSIEGLEKHIEMQYRGLLGSSPTSPVMPVPAQRAVCRAWCGLHDHVEGYCHSIDLPTPGGQWSAPGYVAMSHGPVGGTLIELHHDSDAELTADEAEQLAHAILAQVALARAVNHSGAQA